MGIDGCRYGWCVAQGDEGDIQVELIQHIQEVDSMLSQARTILIDIPIGLPDVDHPREVESLARIFLKKRASSVFQTPCREAVYAGSYQEALERHRAYAGKGISIQSWHICPKIKEVDVFLRSDDTYVNILKESHPEVCFYMLQKNPKVLASKKTLEGRQARVEILKKWIPEVREIFAKARSNYKKKDVQDDDILDALCLWTVGWISKHKGLSKIGKKQVDAYGFDMNMHYSNPYGHEV